LSDKSIAQRMFIKPDYVLVILNAPQGYLDTLGNLPENVTIHANLVSNTDIIQFFTKSQAELKENFPILKQALKDEGSLWITYPKRSSKVETDLNRDIIWQIGQHFGLGPVAMISIDSVWAAFRMRKTN